MTFKHNQFDDSFTMRSLARIAQEKGWIKEIQKTASSAKVDLKPSKDLIENLLKLSEGLRCNGFAAQAEDIESKLVMYKQAQASVYDISKETGEDVINSAHPDGSYKMKDINSDEATFETVLDKHLKILNVVNKAPTGKTGKDILQAVKLVMAQTEDVVSLLKNVYKNCYEAYQLAAKVGNISQRVLTWTQDKINVIYKVTQKSLQELTVNDINECIQSIKDMQNFLKPVFLSQYLPDWANQGINDESVWNKVNEKFDISLKYCALALESLKKQTLSSDSTPSSVIQVPETVISSSPMIQKLLALSNKLRAYSVVGNISKNKTAIQWIKQELKEIQDLISRINSIPEGQEEVVKFDIEKEISTKEDEVGQFAQSWLGK